MEHAIKSYLLAGIAASGDNGDTADLEELHLILLCGWSGDDVVVEGFVVTRKLQP